MKNKKNLLLVLAVIIVLLTTYITFSPTINFPFTNWDDDVFITENPDIKELNWKSIKKIFSSSHCGLYVPLVVLSFSIENSLFGMDAKVYHRDNLMLHLVNCIMVFWLIYILSKNIIVSFIVSILFGIHPLHIESLVWLVERKDQLFTLFYLGALISYIYFRTDKKNNRNYLYYLSLFLYLLSLLSKAMAISLPLILILLDTVFFKKNIKESVRKQIPFLLVSLLFYIVSVFVISNVNTGHPQLSLIEKILSVIYLFFFYLYKLLLPINLSARYTTNLAELLPHPLWTALLIPVVLSIFYWFYLKNKKIVIFGSLFYFLSLMPVTPLIFLGYPYGDRYSYVPSLGIFLIIGFIFVHFFNKETKYRKILRISLITGLAGIIFILSYQTRNHSRIWQSSISLWNNVMKYDTTNCLAYYNRGKAYALIGKSNEAMDDFTRAIVLEPDYFDAYNNIGVIFLERKEYKKALFNFNTAIKIDPGCKNAYYNRGLLWGKLQNYRRAIADFSMAVKIDPSYILAYYYRAFTYERLGYIDLALADYYKTIKLDKGFHPGRQRIQNLLNKK